MEMLNQLLCLAKKIDSYGMWHTVFIEFSLVYMGSEKSLFLKKYNLMFFYLDDSVQTPSIDSSVVRESTYNFLSLSYSHP